MDLDIDRDGATVTVKISGTYTANELQAVLKRIGQARAQIAIEPAQPQSDTPVDLPANWAYHCRWGEETAGKLEFLLRHQGFGWIGLALPPAEAAKLARALADYLVYTTSQQPASPARVVSRDDVLSGEGSGGATLH